MPSSAWESPSARNRYKREGGRRGAEGPLRPLRRWRRLCHRLTAVVTGGALCPVPRPHRIPAHCGREVEHRLAAGKTSALPGPVSRPAWHRRIPSSAGQPGCHGPGRPLTRRPPPTCRQLTRGLLGDVCSPMDHRAPVSWDGRRLPCAAVSRQGRSPARHVPCMAGRFPLVPPRGRVVLGVRLPCRGLFWTP